MTLRKITSITATTDFHSTLDAAPALMAYLEDLRATSLIVDCGDFFEGTGYYRLGNGALEARILDGFYDVLAPGNHGWRHYLHPLLRPITVCANVVDEISTLFTPYFITRVGSWKVGITGIIGTDAFATIPPCERFGHTALEPAQALNTLYTTHRNEADGWVLLSHSGFEHDLALAEACPWLDVIFSGHCHSPHTGPALVGSTMVIKASELGRGVAVARLGRRAWVGVATVVPSDTVPETSGSVEICREIEVLHARLAEPCGPLSPERTNEWLDREVLASHVVLAAREVTGAHASLINHTALRDHGLGKILTQGDLMAVEPFDATLVVLRFPKPQKIAELVERIEPIIGPLATNPYPLPETVMSLATTAYIADTFLPEFTDQTPGVSLASLVTNVLCANRRPGGSS